MRLIRLTPERKLALLLALMSVLIIPTALLSPMGGDQGVFSLIGKLIGDGALPYRDIWDIKGPLVYYLYALGQLVTPQKMLGTLCLDVGLFALAFYNLYRLVAPKGQTATALLAGIIMLAGGSFDYLRAGQPDSWCGYLCVILACQLAQLTPHRLTRTAILCGLAIGLMCLIKPTYALLIGAVAVVFYYSSPSLRTLLKPATAFSVAFLAPVLGMIGYLFACEAGDSVVQIGLSYLAAHRYAYDLTFFSYAFIFFSGPTGLSLLMLILGSVYGLVLMARAEKKTGSELCSHLSGLAAGLSCSSQAHDLPAHALAAGLFFARRLCSDRSKPLRREGQYCAFFYQLPAQLCTPSFGFKLLPALPANHPRMSGGCYFPCLP